MRSGPRAAAAADWATEKDKAPVNQSRAACCLTVRVVCWELVLRRVRTASTAVVIENEQPDHGREIGFEALAALAVDGINEAPYRSPLRSSDALERIPEGVLEAQAGFFMPADIDASFDNQGGAGLRMAEALRT
jgi:hypothetical protein